MRDEIIITTPKYIYFLYTIKKVLYYFIYLYFIVNLLYILIINPKFYLKSYGFIYLTILIFIYLFISLICHIWYFNIGISTRKHYNIENIINHEIGHLIIAEYYLPGIVRKIYICHNYRFTEFIETGWYTLGEIHFSKDYENPFSWQNKVKMYLAGELCTIYFDEYIKLSKDSKRTFINELSLKILNDIDDNTLPIDHDYSCINSILKKQGFTSEKIKRLLTEYIYNIFNIFDTKFTIIYLMRKELTKSLYLEKNQIQYLLYNIYNDKNN